MKELGKIALKFLFANADTQRITLVYIEKFPP